MPIWPLAVVELMFLAAFVAGIAVIYWPAALIVGGIVGFFACEAIGAKIKENRAVEAVKKAAERR